MAKKVKEKPVWINALGENVPDSAVQPYDKRKEKVIQALLKKAQKVNKELEEIKKAMISEGDKLYEERLVLRGFKQEETCDESINDGKGTDKTKKRKGNYTLFSYSKNIKFEMNIRDVTSFNDDISLAQLKLNEYITEITDGTDKDLQLLVSNAFRTTQGRLDKARVLNLLSYDIKNPKWVEAMNLIRASISVNSTKRYPVISVRNEEGEYETVNLNFSSI